jgi:predicted  nucleic acid-binding Zn-ribbon protein
MQEDMGSSVSYRKSAIAMVKLAEVDSRIEQSQSFVASAERAVEELKLQLDEMSVQLDARKRGSLASKDVADSKADAHYRRLVERYEEASRIARLQRRAAEGERQLLDLRRSRLVPEIPPDLLATYETLNRVGQRPVIAPLMAGICMACRTRVGPDLYHQIESMSQPIRCPRCERFLYLPSWEGTRTG